MQEYERNESSARPVQKAVERAKELRHEITSEAASYSASVANAGKQSAVRGLDSVVASLQAAAHELNDRDERLGAPIQSVATRLGNIASHIENQNLGELTDEACEFARTHPAAFLGGAVALGFLLGRAVRAHSPAPSVADLDDGTAPRGAAI